MKLIKWLFEHFEEYYAHERRVYLKYAGIVGSIGYLLFYLIYIFVVRHPYENLPIRVGATLLCLPMIWPERWPEKLKRYRLAHAYFTIMYCLPFFHVFMTLKNQGGIVMIVDSMMAVFFLVLITDWRNTIVMLLLGGTLGVALYISTTPNPSIPMDYVERLPTVILVVIGGSLFKFSEKRMTDKLKLTTALAGSIAHEMRNPLGQIKYSLDCIEHSLPSGGAARSEQAISAQSLAELYRQLTQGRRAIERGLQVISMTLDEVGDKAIDTSGFTYLHVGQVTRKAVDEYSYESESMRRKVSVTVEQDFIFRGDETVYMFVLFNLIKNALYYGLQYPQLTIDIHIKAAEICVTDTGPGIAADVLPQLFAPFATAGKSGGTGLGLAYCRRALLAFGGDIGCESVAGKFTRFRMQIPEVTQAEFDVYHQELEIAAKSRLHGKHVLIVDDDEQIRQSTARLLDGLGMQIEEAANGLAALECLHKGMCDVIIMDVNMPVLDGYATTEKIRAGVVRSKRFVPILAYSAEPEGTLQAMSAKAGMNGFLNKPCSRSDLIAALSAAVIQAGHQASYRTMASALAGKTVLVADDNVFNRMIANGYLQQWGVKVLIAGLGMEVLAHLNEQTKIDAILMDLNMPGMNGIDTTLAIRIGNVAHRHIPILALTGDSGSEIVERAYAAGMDDFITKPLDALELCEKLHYHILKHAQRDETARAPADAGISADNDSVVRPTDLPLLNTERLDEFRDLDMLDSLPLYLDKAEQTLAALQAAASRSDFKAMHEAMHSLLGMSGDVGAAALHRALQRYYPALAKAQIPDDADWLVQIERLHLQTARALHDGYIQPGAGALP